MRQIHSLGKLMAAVDDRKAVICPNTMAAFRRPIPAAVIANMQGAIIHRLIKAGMFIYEPKKERHQRRKP